MAARTAPIEASQIYSIRLADEMHITKFQLAAAGNGLGFCLGNARDRASYASTSLIVLDQHVDQYLHSQTLQHLMGLFNTNMRCWTSNNLVTKTDLAEELPSSELTASRRHEKRCSTGVC
ncbi:hypothetical protein E4U48_003309 [Claviceps purpurea]|nr:hypothetical protein E4U26_004786 [Claviceps purpurea]KAG6272002.1 hypothetical protein E4U48_003309 [Claviceps purpurea]